MAQSDINVPELGSDADDDEALRYAIALSLRDQQQLQPDGTSRGNDNRGTGPEMPPKQGQTTFGSFQLNRKKMEEERLQRLAKRRRSDSDDDVVEVPPPKKSVHVKAPLTPNTKVPYPTGTVKRTWSRGYPRTSDDIKIEEIFQKDQLLLAVLSSFQWDEEWMISKLDLSKTKVLLMAFAADDAQVRNPVRAMVT
jgi:hypothetical protein